MKEDKEETARWEREIYMTTLEELMQFAAEKNKDFEKHLFNELKTPRTLDTNFYLYRGYKIFGSVANS